MSDERPIQDHACETCCKPAAVGVADLQEIEPVTDDDGVRWRRWETTASHYYCDEHAKPGTKIYRDGSVEEHPPRERN